MPDLKPLTALGTAEARTQRFAALTVSENDRVALASLALRRGSARPAPFGLALPEPGGWVCGDDGMAAYWIAPDQWMVEGADRAGMDFAAEVLAQSPGCSVTEQTDGFTSFDVRAQAGEAPIQALLAKLINIDPCRLPPGSAVRTGLEHMSVFAIRRAPGHLTFTGMRSSAGSLWHALATAAQRQGGEGAWTPSGSGHPDSEAQRDGTGPSALPTFTPQRTVSRSEP